MQTRTFFLTVFALALPAGTALADENDWRPLFNGKNLDGWVVKITGHELGENPGDTFRVEDGLLKVRYDGYEKFDGRFGHIFYQQPFAHYRLRVEYRFVDEQVAEGPSWAFRNSGIMLHCQPPGTIAKEQKFPVSIEVQLLGGRGDNRPRTTGNLCTPGTHVVMDGKLLKRHCTSSTSRTYHGDQWVTIEVEVRGSQVIRHQMEGETVLQYEQPQLDKQDPDARRWLEQGQPVALEKGYISLQSESHPVEFRKVEIMKLEAGQ